MQFERRARLGALGLAVLLVNSVSAQQLGAEGEVPVHLKVEPGTPLRLYITHRVWHRIGEPVEARLIEPVWAFDRVVIPAGATVQGQAVGLDPVSRMMRARAMAGGDFTPLKRARVAFTRVTLPDGRTTPLQTAESFGLSTIYVPPRPPKKPTNQSVGPAKANRALQLIEQQAQNQATARSRGLYDLVRGPNKREWIENYVLSKLPYHPQWYRARTRFDAVLTQPLDFGTVKITASELATPGTVSSASNSLAEMRLLTTVSSADARVGDPIEGLLSQPLFADQHKLVLPEGMRFTGRVTLAQRARLFHRGGKLRFTIENVNLGDNKGVLAQGTALNEANKPVEGQLASVEADPKAIEVDSEGTATARESKTRLFRPAIAALVATKSLDNDAGKQTATGTGAPNNTGRSLGGFSGFGLLGTVAARGPHPIGAALGFYGLTWSVYSNLVARGSEVTFQKNTAVAIQFGNPRNK